MTFFNKKQLIFLNKIEKNTQERKIFDKRFKIFSKFKYRYRFIDRLKVIQNIMKFFHLCIKFYL